MFIKPNKFNIGEKNSLRLGQASSLCDPSGQWKSDPYGIPIHVK